MAEWDPPAEDLLHENATGCLAGIAIGDALGNWFESAGSGGARRDGEAAGMDPFLLMPAMTSDDTAQAIALAESIIACNGFVPADFAGRLVTWYEQRPEGIGNHTALVLALASRGEDWEKAALDVQTARPESAGNGSLMRCAPVALFDHAAPRELVDDSRLSSRVTHPHSECQWSCAFTNLVIAELLGGATPDRAVTDTLAFCARRDDVNREVVERARLASLHGTLRNLRPSGYVLDTLECSLWCLLHTDDFESALTRAVSLGGDSDTIGAVTGALAGAAYGLDAIPESWLDHVAEAGQLEELAVALLELS
ncbi:MAG: ADP-ribosylglycohydrolase family protein [Thermoleophilia bacterium]